MEYMASDGRFLFLVYRRFLFVKMENIVFYVGEIAKWLSDIEVNGKNGAERVKKRFLQEKRNVCIINYAAGSRIRDAEALQSMK